ncbi:hypothetical protein ACHAW5_002683 [Stephanodiscus triporus]|uniref:Uncharacterized protein n=1 Tax=Stephanodiscus triporus TaxID=2934178 RepID=A0ABD3N9H7_9STRA
MGDFQAKFLRPDAGINNIEWNVAGSHVAGLLKKCSIEQSLFEERKAKIKADSEHGKLRIDDKFDANVGSSREELGSVTVEEFCKASAEVERARGRRGEGIFGEQEGGGGHNGNDMPVTAQQMEDGRRWMR